MLTFLRRYILCWSFVTAAYSAYAETPAPTPIADAHRSTPVSFTNEILPILQKNCLACHNAKDAENGLSLESAEAVRKGGADGPVLMPGKGAESRLLQLAARQQEPIMPPPDNKVGAVALTPEQLGLLKLWIVQGAQGDAAAVRRVIERHPLPNSLQPIQALAVTSDDEYVACSRGDRLFIYYLPDMRLAAKLTDPSIAGRRAAHDDVVRSLAFDRSGDLLASGGFRTVKIWRRPRSRIEREIASAMPITATSVTRDGRRLARGTPSGTIELIAMGCGRSPTEPQGQTEGLPSRDVTGRPTVQTTAGSGDPRRTDVLSGHKGAVLALAFAADGKLFSAGVDKTVRAWDTAEAKELGRFTVPAQPRALAILQGETQLATAEADQVIRLWDITALAPQPDGVPPTTPLRELKGHNKPVTCLVAVRTPERLLSGSEDGRLRLWNTSTGETLREFDHGAAVTAVAVSPDGKRLASVGMTGVIRLWNADDGAMIAETKGDPRTARALGRAESALNYAKACVEYRKEEQRQAEEQLKRETAVAEGAVKAKEQAEKTLAEKQQAADKATAARTTAEEAAKPAAEALAAAVQAKIAAETAADDAQKAVNQAASDLEKAGQAAAQDKENKELAAAREAAEKTLNEAKQKKQAAESALQQAVQALRQAQQKNEQATQAVRRAAEQAKQPLRQLDEAKSALQGAINFIGTANAVAERAKAAVPEAQKRLTDADALVARREMEKKSAADAMQAPAKPLASVAFLPDSSRLVTTVDEIGLCFYEAENLGLVEVLETSPLKIASIVATDDGWLFATAADGRTIVIATAARWNLERTIGRPDDPDQLVDRVLSLDFSPDDKLLATGSGLPARSGQLKLWNLSELGATPREIADAHRDTIYGLRFSPDGQYLASASADRLAKVFRVSDGELVKALVGHTHHVLGVAWSADGRLLATAGGDQVVKLWDFERATPMRTIRGDAYRIGPYKREVNSISFIGDTEHLVTSSGDGTVRLHRTSSDRDVRAFKEGVTFTHAAAATSDGRLIFGGGRDGILYVFNGESGYKIAENKPEE